MRLHLPRLPLHPPLHLPNNPYSALIVASRDMIMTLAINGLTSPLVLLMDVGVTALLVSVVHLLAVASNLLSLHMQLRTPAPTLLPHPPPPPAPLPHFLVFISFEQIQCLLSLLGLPSTIEKPTGKPTSTDPPLLFDNGASHYMTCTLNYLTER